MNIISTEHDTPFGLVTRTRLVPSQSDVEVIYFWDFHQVVLGIRAVGTGISKEAAYVVSKVNIKLNIKHSLSHHRALSTILAWEAVRKTGLGLAVPLGNVFNDSSHPAVFGPA